jgi:hypothetical protein
MTTPISPPPVQGGARDELPAYVANGVRSNCHAATAAINNANQKKDASLGKNSRAEV